MKRYEYTLAQIWGGRNKTEWILNSYGAEGWELVFVISVWHYFKREIIEEQNKQLSGNQNQRLRGEV